MSQKPYFKNRIQITHNGKTLLESYSGKDFLFYFVKDSEKGK